MREVEEWRVYPSDKRLEVSNLGGVRNTLTKRIRRLCPIKSGYLCVSMRGAEGKRFNYYVHRMVAEAFLGIIPEGYHVCHNDGNISLNTLENLRIDTAKGNHSDKVKHGTLARGEDIAQSKLTAKDVLEIRGLVSSGTSMNSLSSVYGVSSATVRRAVTGECWSHL